MTERATEPRDHKPPPPRKPPARPRTTAPAETSVLLALQRTAGNAAVSDHVAQREGSPGQTAALGPERVFLPPVPPPPRTQPSSGSVPRDTAPPAAVPVAPPITREPTTPAPTPASPPAPAERRGVRPPESMPAPTAETAESPPGPAPATVVHSGDGAGGRQAEALRQEAAAVRAEALAERVAVFTALDQEGATGRTAATAAAETARAQVTEAYDAEAQNVTGQATATLAAIEQARLREQAAIAAAGTAERQRLQDAHRTEREGAEAHTRDLTNQVRETGEQQAQRALAEGEQRAQAVTAEAAAVQTGGEAPLAEAQRSSARQIAERAAVQCRQSGRDLAAGVRQEAGRHATDRYQEISGGFRSTLDQAAAQADRSITDFQAQAARRIDEAAAGAAATVRHLAAQARAAIGRERAAAEDEIGQWRADTLATYDDGGAERVREPVTAEHDTALAELDAATESGAAELSAVDDPERAETAAAEKRQALTESKAALIDGTRAWGADSTASLTQRAQTSLTALTSLVEARRTAATEAGTRTVAGLTGAAADSDTAMAQTTAGFRQRVAGAVDTAVGEFGRAGADLRAQLAGPHGELLAGLAAFVDDGLAGQDSLLADARGEIGGSASRIQARFGQLKSEADRQSADGNESVSRLAVQRSWWGDLTSWAGRWIERTQRWFADTFGEFWGGLLFGVLAALVIVAVGLAAGYIIGAIVGAIIVSAKVAAIVTAVILVVAAIGMGIYSRYQEFYEDNPNTGPSFWQHLGLIGLGIADLTGIPFLIEGWVGQRAFGRELTEFERGERIGFGAVFFLAALYTGFRGVKYLLRPRPAVPLEPHGPVPEPRAPRPAELPPAAMSERLRGIRETLTDPKAIEQFDRMFESMRGDSGRMERAVDGMSRAGSIQDRLVADWERANGVTPTGAAITEVPGLKTRAENLLAEIRAWVQANASPEVRGQSWIAALEGEIARLERMLRGQVEATPEAVQGTRNNVNGVEREFEIARRATDVTGTGRTFSLDGRPNAVEVDVVADGGRTWIDGKAVEPFGLDSSNWTGGRDTQGLRTQAAELVRSAGQNPVNGTPPTVVIDFPLGVSAEVAAALRAMGVQVRGTVVEFPSRPVPVVRPPGGIDDRDGGVDGGS